MMPQVHCFTFTANKLRNDKHAASFPVRRISIWHIQGRVFFCCVPFKSWTRVHEITWSW